MNNLTQKQIARVFAMYVGQKCQYPDLNQDNERIAILTGVSLGDGIETTYLKPEKERGSVTHGDYLSFKPNGNHDTDALHCKLLLRPLSAITDEDAVEVAKMAGWEAAKTKQYMLVQDGRFTVAALYGENNSFSPLAVDAVNIHAFLIQRGYAVPLFIAPGHPCNGKDAIALGLGVDASVGLPYTN